MATEDDCCSEDAILLAGGEPCNEILALTPSSYTKGALVEMALEECGRAGFLFELTPEEMTSTLRRLNSLMWEWKAQGLDMGYAFPTSGEGQPSDASNIPNWCVEAVTSYLALRRAPNIGKAFSSESRKALASSMSFIRAKFAVIPTSIPASGTPRGAGSRNIYGTWWGRGPFFPGQR